jgi:hypothetical protein
MPTSDLLSGLAALVITIGLLTYLVADNPLYRVISHLFIGVTAGYVALLAWYSVIEPQLFAPLVGGLGAGNLLGNLRLLVIQVVGLIGGLLLLLKSAHVAGRLGTLVVALMVGVGVAVAVGGGLTGTLIPQTAATMVPLLPLKESNWPVLAVEGLFTVVGTLTTLGFFYYGGRAEPGSPVERPALIKPVAAVGQLFIGAAFGMMYAGALAASVAIFAARMGDVWGFVRAVTGQ